MSETKIDPSIIRTYEVKPQHIYLPPDDKQTSSTEYRLARHMAIEGRVSPNPLLAIGIEEAKKQIIKREEELDLVVKKKQSMRVAILPPELYKKVYELLTKEEYRNSTSAYVPGMGTVLHTETQDPYYLQASDVYHEWVHRFLEVHVQVEAEMNQLKGGRREKSYFDNRSGIAVEQIHTTKEGRQKDRRGEMLNELGNYLEQNIFIQRLLRMPEFATEIENKQKMLAELNLHDGLFGGFAQKPDGTRVQVIFTQNNLHAKDNGQLSITNSDVYMQFACDLALFCDPEHGGEEFRKLLLLARIDPVRQNDLRIMIDSKLGEGFYTKLKDMKYEVDDNFWDMFVYLQSRLYPNKVVA